MSSSPVTSRPSILVKLQDPQVKHLVVEARACLEEIRADIIDLQARIRALKAIAVLPPEFLSGARKLERAI